MADDDDTGADVGAPGAPGAGTTASVEVIDPPVEQPEVTGDEGRDDAAVSEEPAERRGSRFEELAAGFWRKVTRRPLRWAAGPWTNERIAQAVTAGIVLAVSTWIMLNVVHLAPGDSLVLDDNTPTGGDMGAHVWGPAYLRDHLLPNFQLNGWSMDWYGGLPVYRFYMLVPALAIVALDVILPYGIAFKLVAVSGLVALPLCCWAFGRLARFRYPMPELFALAGVAFALQETYSIYGGNLKSTMAGEFSFSIALSLMILGFGLLARGLETGKYRSWAAIVLALAIVSHGIVAIYTAVGALVIVIVHLDNVKRFVYGLTVGVATVLLSAFWIGPFVGNHAFMTDMKYGGRPDGASDSFWDMFFPFTAPLDILITGFAVIGFLACIARRQATGVALGVVGLLAVAGVYWTKEDGLPIIGLLWNPRILPLLVLIELVLMMVGIVEVVGLIWAAIRNVSARESADLGGSIVAVVIGSLGVLIPLGWWYEVLPFDGRSVEHGHNVYSWGPFHKPVPPDPVGDYAAKGQGQGWASYNFKGYEGRPHYPEYYDTVQAMARIGDERGCGRATWENNGDNGQYGTPMALMLLPFWTDGCIASMEGLFFEASGTTPYHFITTAAMSKQSSNPVRELRYENNNADIGVRHLQDIGSRYVMLRTPEAQEAADAQPDLTLLETVGTWKIYEVASADIVQPLTVQPVVVERRSGDQRERNLELGMSWFQHPEDWAAIPADDGPEDWQRITASADPERLVPDPYKCLADPDADDGSGTTTTSTEPCQPDTSGKQVDIVIPDQEIERVELDPVEVSNVEIEEQGLSFSVDQIGVPVLVKVSYFPNWSVDGAEGPYRIAPNFMVVVPTERDVSMNFERSRSDLFFYLLTLGGIVLLIVLRRKGDADVRSRWELAPAAAGAAPIEVTAGDAETAPADPWTVAPPPSGQVPWDDDVWRTPDAGPPDGPVADPASGEPADASSGAPSDDDADQPEHRSPAADPDPPVV